MFKLAAGGLVLKAAYQLLGRDCTYDQLITAVTNCVLPAGARLLQITDGSVYLKVQADSLAALEHLWRLYKNGTLKKRLQVLFVTDEMKERAGGEQVEVVVTIEEEEYEKARDELATVEAQGYKIYIIFTALVLPLSTFIVDEVFSLFIYIYIQLDAHRQSQDSALLAVKERNRPVGKLLKS